MQVLFALKDSEKGKRVQVRMTVHDNKEEVSFYIDGYSTTEDFGPRDVQDTPLVLRYSSGKLEVVAWPDINSDQSTCIDLEGARIDRRQ